MFVRLFVDENLDRHVPISKQPKEKIQVIFLFSAFGFVVGFPNIESMKIFGKDAKYDEKVSSCQRRNQSAMKVSSVDLRR